MKQIQLTKGFIALIDDEDYDRVTRFKWSAAVRTNTVYGCRVDDTGAMVMLHQFITGVSRTDHRDRNGLNNQKLNLRPCTQSQNMGNIPRHRDNQSGFKGVSWHKRDERFRARIQGTHLGNFITAEEAAHAYDAAARERFGEFARTNF